MLVAQGKITRGIERLRTAFDLEGKAGESLAHALFNQANGKMGDINADPLPPQLLRGVNGSTAASEGIEHHMAFIGGGGDNAFEQRKGFLGGVAEAFLGLGVQGSNIIPVITKRDTGHLI